MRSRLHLAALLALGAPPASAVAAPGDPLVVGDDTLAPPETFLAAVYRVSLADGSATQLTGAEALFDAKGLAIISPGTAVTVAGNQAPASARQLARRHEPPLRVRGSDGAEEACAPLASPPFPQAAPHQTGRVFG
jgi:hypothetical protein